MQLTAVKNKLIQTCSSSTIYITSFKSLIHKKASSYLPFRQGYQEETEKHEAKESATDFLNGFRGLCAFIIIAQHSRGTLGPGEVNTLMHHIFNANHLTSAIALPGFFLLSSFLLTYRLMGELLAAPSSTNSSKYANIGKIISKYFIRRFFRIYLVFVVFCTIIKVFPWINGGISPFADWKHLVSLTFSMGDPNHLWTIPVEINYYFFMPVVCLLVLAVDFKSKLARNLILACFFVLSYLHLRTDLFAHFPNNPFVVNPGNFRKPTFATFLLGSLLGLLLDVHSFSFALEH